ncbi:SURF1 family protein [Lysobacter silvisoli]|uniref:SURF1-like protein n=1 Tax=Lysobacter silvisoli TaxID=2293254 RepID=A0A371K4R8_9GAMM|nr:SURF1 family protein [Lysobacter silvisoli]
MFAAALLLAFAGFLALGVWQVQRLGWKRDLIARVDARVQAAPTDAPARAGWVAVSDSRDSYRRVRVSGRFVPGKAARTQAVTELGAGVWLLQPLQTDDGDYVWVNRGFVPTGDTGRAAPQGRVELVGLLRMSEPGGGFLRRNDPQHDRWYSRDVRALALARGLPAERVAPYFIDAARAGDGRAWPRGGMTVVKFRDSHLSYALTWFGLAALTLVGAGWLFASERRLRQDRARAKGRADHAHSTGPG